MIGSDKKLFHKKRRAVLFNSRDRGDAIVWRPEEEKALSNSFLLVPTRPGFVKGQSGAALYSKDPTPGGGSGKGTQGWLQPASHSPPEGSCSLF